MKDFTPETLLGKSNDGTGLALQGLDVHQPDLPDGQLLIALDEALHQLGCVAAAAADSDDFDRSGPYLLIAPFSRMVSLCPQYRGGVLWTQLLRDIPGFFPEKSSRGILSSGTF